MKYDLEKDWGYPREGIVDLDLGGGDALPCPQEMWSARTCGSCKLFDGEYCTKEWNNADPCYCVPERDEKDPDTDYCDDIDYIEEHLEELRDPVRHEYSSDKAYKQACEAIDAIRKYQAEQEEHDYYVQHYGKDYWRDEDDTV